MKSVHYTQIAPQIQEALSHGGAFLSAKHQNSINTMTIGWAFFGPSWKKDCFVAMVRKSRHTHAMIEESGVFTVSIPAPGTLREQLALCGSKSGRDMDKFAAAGLTPVSGSQVDCPIVGECAFHMECRVVLTQDMTPDRLDAAIDKSAYAKGDYHTLYFGEILRCYES